MKIEPAASVRGTFTLPGDKSISHRAAILGAMAEGETRIVNFSEAADCASTLGCLRGLGVRVARDGSEVVIQGGLESWRAPASVLDAGNSGSTIRMLAGPLAGRPVRATLTGDESLSRRPLERVAAPLRAMGATLETSDGHAPLTITGGALRGMTHELPVASAQVKTALLLAGLSASGRTTVREPMPSRDHTERMLPAFGARVVRDGLAASVDGGQRLRGTSVDVPGDASSAAFLVVAALVLPDSEMRLEGVLLSPTRTAFLEVLRAMGGRVEVLVERTEPEPVGTIVASSSSLVGTRIDPALVPSLIDEVPALAVAGAFASGRLEVTGAGELRHKETDRIAALTRGLTALGARVEERPDGLVVEGGAPLRGAQVDSEDDHRIAMALSVAALGARGASEVARGECVAVSFPSFYEVLGRATGRG
ncbi:MAG: 3-phosphoshikimate 1-carboxyvinyltransferase [Burkholderiales bacterium]